MRRPYLAISVLLAGLGCSGQPAGERDFKPSALEGSYLGQTPPGPEPAVFADRLMRCRASPTSPARRAAASRMGMRSTIAGLAMGDAEELLDRARALVTTLGQHDITLNVPPGSG